MRTMKAFMSVLTVALLCAGVASAKINKPETISTKGAHNICSGHGGHTTSGGGWGCGFCGPHDCTNVDCPKGGKCSVTIVNVKGKPGSIRTGVNGTKGTGTTDPARHHPVNVTTGTKPVVSSGSTPPEGKAGGMQHGGGYRR